MIGEEGQIWGLVHADSKAGTLWLTAVLLQPQQVRWPGVERQASTEAGEAVRLVLESLDIQSKRELRDPLPPTRHVREERPRDPVSIATLAELPACPNQSTSDLSLQYTLFETGLQIPVIAGPV